MRYDDLRKGKKMDRTSYLEGEKISKLLFRFSIPCIASLLISALYNIVDQIFVGNSVGYLGNAATGVAFPILIITMAFSWCYGDGAAAYLSICQGRRDTENAHKCVGSLIIVTTLTSAALIALFLMLDEPLLSLFGATYDSYDKDGALVAGSMEMAKQYFWIVVCALTPNMLTNALSSIIRADGSPGFAMIATLSGAIINIVLDALFIVGFGWGIQGAAYATIIGQIASFALTVFYFLRKTKTFKLTAKSFGKDMRAFFVSLKLGISTFITQISIVVMSLVCSMMMKKYAYMSASVGYDPSIPISAASIETKVFTLIINIVVGIILGAQPIVGYNYGAKRFDRVRECYKWVAIVTLSTGIISTVICELFPGALVQMFGTSGSNSELYFEFAKKTFRIFLSCVTFTCFIKMSAIFFQAVGKPVSAMISSLVRDILLFIPLVVLLPTRLGIDGILIASPISDIVAMAVCVFLSIKFFKELKKSELEMK